MDAITLFSCVFGDFPVFHGVVVSILITPLVACLIKWLVFMACNKGGFKWGGLIWHPGGVIVFMATVLFALPISFHIAHAYSVSRFFGMLGIDRIELDNRRVSYHGRAIVDKTRIDVLQVFLFHGFHRGVVIVHIVRWDDGIIGTIHVDVLGFLIFYRLHRSVVHRSVLYIVVCDNGIVSCDN